MKKILLAVALLAGVATVSAQGKGKIGVGATLNYATKNEMLGAGAKLQYGLTDNFRLDANVTYFFEKQNISTYDASLNLQYVLPVAQNFNIYPLAGGGMYGWRFTAGPLSDSDTLFGVNLGVGASYQLTPSLSIGAEAKYILTSVSVGATAKYPIKNFNTPVIGANVIFSI